MRVTLDARCMEERKDTHHYLKEKLKFPEYYGHNLDSLNDCLTEMTDLEIVFEHTEEAGKYFWQVHRVFERAGQQNDQIKIME